MIRLIALLLLVCVLSSQGSSGQVTYNLNATPIQTAIFQPGGMSDVYLPTTLYPSGAPSIGTATSPSQGFVLPFFTAQILLLPTFTGMGGTCIDYLPQFPQVYASDGVTLTCEAHPRYPACFAFGPQPPAPFAINLVAALAGTGVTPPISGLAIGNVSGVTGRVLFIADGANNIRGFTINAGALATATGLLPTGIPASESTTGIGYDAFLTSLWVSTIDIAGVTRVYQISVAGGGQISATGPQAGPAALSLTVNNSAIGGPYSVIKSDGVSIADALNPANPVIPSGAIGPVNPPYGMAFSPDAQYASAVCAGPGPFPPRFLAKLNRPAVIGATTPATGIEVPQQGGIVAGITQITALVNSTVTPITAPSPVGTTGYCTHLNLPTTLTPVLTATANCTLFPGSITFSPTTLGAQAFWFNPGPGVYEFTDSFFVVYALP